MEEGFHVGRGVGRRVQIAETHASEMRSVGDRFYLEQALKLAVK